MIRLIGPKLQDVGMREPDQENDKHLVKISTIVMIMADWVQLGGCCAHLFSQITSEKENFMINLSVLNFIE